MNLKVLFLPNVAFSLFSDQSIDFLSQRIQTGFIICSKFAVIHCKNSKPVWMKGIYVLIHCQQLQFSELLNKMCLGLGPHIKAFWLLLISSHSGICWQTYDSVIPKRKSPIHKQTLYGLAYFKRRHPRCFRDCLHAGQIVIDSAHNLTVYLSCNFDMVLELWEHMCLLTGNIAVEFVIHDIFHSFHPLHAELKRLFAYKLLKFGLDTHSLQPCWHTNHTGSTDNWAFNQILLGKLSKMLDTPKISRWLWIQVQIQVQLQNQNSGWYSNSTSNSGWRRKLHLQIQISIQNEWLYLEVGLYPISEFEMWNYHKDQLIWRALEQSNYSLLAGPLQWTLVEDFELYNGGDSAFKLNPKSIFKPTFRFSLGDLPFSARLL